MKILHRLLWIVVLMSLLVVRSAYAQQDAAELETFVDGLIAAQRESYQLAGVVMAVVQDGDLLLSKGYGYPDVENRVPVDPAHILFRIGSTTKLFTWTAVMQLVEEGRVLCGKLICSAAKFL